jgi:hypothetical protein
MVETEPIISKTVFFGVSLAAVSAGMLYGVKRVLKEEKITLNMKQHGSAVGSAGLALLGGTLLCCGTFLGGASLFVAGTGITSFKEFGIASRRVTTKYDIKHPPNELSIRDREAVKGMTSSEEWDYLTKGFFPTFDKNGIAILPNDDRENKNDDTHEIDDKKP